MIYIPGWFIQALTFPGVVIHEWAHKKYCEWTGIRVHEVVYFRMGQDPAGFVKHEKPKEYNQVFLISIAPLIINSLLAIVLSLIASQTEQESPFYYILLWISISVGMHALPSEQDIKHILEASKTSLKNRGSFLRHLSLLFCGLINFLNKFGILFGFWYAIILAWLGGCKF